MATLSYPAADLDPAKAKLAVRAREADARATPADLTFAFEGANKISIQRPDGYDAGAIYEFIYLAKDPKVMGLGFAATRDVVSFLRHETADAAANPLAGRIDRAIGCGTSQSGRYLQDFLYLGFNADESGRTVFEGLMPHISGGKKTFTNYRFSQPGRSPYQHADMLYPGADFPFSYPVITDALTGKRDGFLARCLAAGNCPKIIKTDSELEFYQQRASLVVTDTQGNPLAMPDNVRLFLLSNLQHFALANAKSERVKTCAFPTNPLNAGPPARALLVALDAWISNGTLPPASRYPSPQRRHLGAIQHRRRRLSAHSRLRLHRAHGTSHRYRPRGDAAGKGRGLSGLCSQNRCRRPRPRRHSPADAGSSRGDPHRLESAQGRFRRGRAVRQ